MKTVKTIVNEPYHIDIWMNDGYYCVDIRQDDEIIWSSNDSSHHLGWRELETAESFARNKTNIWIATERSLGVKKMSTDEQYEQFLNKHPADITAEELWKWTPRMLRSMAECWGEALTAHERNILSKLELSGLSRGDVVLALIEMGCE